MIEKTPFSPKNNDNAIFLVSFIVFMTWLFCMVIDKAVFP